MNEKKYVATTIIVFIALQILDFVVHNLLLGSAYERTSALWRPEMTDFMWVMWVTGFIFSAIFVYIFTKGYEDKGIWEGLRYGLLIGILVSFVGSYNQFVVYPIPYYMALYWFIAGTFEIMILGIVAALVYQPK